MKNVSKTVNSKIEEENPYKIEGKLPPFVNENVTCDGCQAYPITGIRYKCIICNNFDFCEKCEASVEHHHNFIKMKKARQCGESFHSKRYHGKHGCSGNESYKISKRTWKLSKIFGGELSTYNNFVSSTLDLECEALIKKYS